MQRIDGIHTAVVLTLVALVPLAPVVMWLYARTASVDRAPIIAANERVFTSVPHLPGARLLSEHEYGVPRWGNEGGLVPTGGFRTEFFIRLARLRAPSMIIAHYRRVLSTWHREGQQGTTYVRGRIRIDIALLDVHAGRTRDYGFYVSQ